MNNKITKQNFLNNFRKLTQSSGFGLICAFLLLFIGLSIASENFLTVPNLLTILNQTSFVAIISIGMTLVIAMGGIDLSVGSTLSLSGMILGGMMLSGFNIYLSIIITLIVGFLIGSVNGILIAKAKITDFIVTLATMTILQGILRVYTAGRPFFGLNWPEFTWFGQGKIIGISIPFIITIIILGIFYFVTYQTTFGRYAISIGSNNEAAKLVGINITKIKILNYGLLGMLAALAGILVASRVSTAMPDAGLGYELKVIAATVIGGTSLSGGKARIVGALIGSVLMTMISNGLNILNISSSWHQIVIGVIILVAVGLDTLSSNRTRIS
jgi:ribose transport system permease protein